MTGFTLSVNNAQYEVLKMLNDNLTIAEIARKRKVSRTAIYKVLSTLNKKGLIRHPKKYVYEITSKGREGLHSFVGLRYNLRQHNLHFKIKILESPKNWELKRNEIRQLPFYNKTIKLQNNDQDLFNFGKIQVKTTTKSIILKMPTIYARDWEHAIIQAVGILEEQIYRIEKIFKIILVKDFKANITIISQEYARLQDALAKLYRKEGNRIYLTGEDGKIWLITDLSFSTDELEFIHTERATDDIDAIAPMLNDLRANPTTFSEVRELITGVVNIQASHAENIVKHQSVLDEIFLSMKEFNRELKDFREWRKKQQKV